MYMYIQINNTLDNLNKLVQIKWFQYNVYYTLKQN